MAITSIKSVMLEEEGRSAGAETNMPAEVADKRRKNPPARLHNKRAQRNLLLKMVHSNKAAAMYDVIQSDSTLWIAPTCTTTLRITLV